MSVRRAVVHALELAEEDVEKWCGELTDATMFARPGGLPPVAFHLRHIARSLDRLLTYAEDRWLDDEQLAALKTELDPGTAAEVLAELREGIITARLRVRDIPPKRFDEPRASGRKRLPTSVAGLADPLAPNTRPGNVGQAVTTGERSSEPVRTLEFSARAVETTACAIFC